MTLRNDASLRIGEIAELFGYQYPSCFIQLFRRRFKGFPIE